MMRNVKRIVFLVVLVTLVGGIQAGNLFAQGDPRGALIGTWEGTVSGTGDSAAMRLDFSEKDGKLLWTWSLQARSGSAEAEGTVTKYEPPSVELSGRYTLHPNRKFQGSPITMSLTVSAASLQGNGLTAAVNRPFTLSATKK